jgi:hypothetical protein
MVLIFRILRICKNCYNSLATLSKLPILSAKPSYVGIFIFILTMKLIKILYRLCVSYLKHF